MPYLSIIIPAYNEAERIPETLRAIQAWVEKQSYEIEVLLVDDGSQDATVAVVQAIMQQFPALRVISYKPNKGKGGAVKTGMLEAKGDWRLFTDADSSTAITEVEKLLPFTGEFEVIIGSRYLKSGSIKVKQPLKRRIISRLGNTMIHLVTLGGIRDTQCGFKLFSARATETIFPYQQETGWLFDVESLTIARQTGFAIKEVAVDWFDAKESKLRALRTISRSLHDLWVIRKRIRQHAYTSIKP